MPCGRGGRLTGRLLGDAGRSAALVQPLPDGARLEQPAFARWLRGAHQTGLQLLVHLRAQGGGRRL